MRIIDKRGPLHNPADRDHCLQYAVAVALIHGELRAEHYEEETARDPRIDRLRGLMERGGRPPVLGRLPGSGKALDRQLSCRSSSTTEARRRRSAWSTPSAIAGAAPRRCRCSSTSCGTTSRGSFPPERMETVVSLFQDRCRLERLGVPELIELFL